MFTFGLRAPSGAGTVIDDVLEVRLVDCIEAVIDDESVKVEIDEEVIAVIDDEVIEVEICD